MHFTPIGSAVQNYSQHDSLLAAEDATHSAERGVYQELCLSTVQIPVPPTRTRWEETYHCTLLGFRTFTGAWSRWVPQQHSQSSCTYKTKDIYCPWENMHGWEVALLWLDPFLPATLYHQPGVLSVLLKKAERLQKLWLTNIFASWRQLCVLQKGSHLWGKMQRVLSVDTVCHGSGRTYSISDHSVAIPVPREVPSARAALVPDGVVGWPWLPGPALSPPGSSLDAGCSVLTCVAVLKVRLRSHHSLHELVLSWGEARGLFITSVCPKGRVTESI